MTTFIAFCDNLSCGAIFEARGIIGGAGNVTVHMTNTRYGPCPVCGSMGLIPDGVYEYIDQTVSFLSGPSSSIQKLKKVKEILELALSQNKAKEEILSDVEKESPEIASALSKLGGLNNVAQWLGILAAVVGVAIQVHTSYFKDDDAAVKDKVIEYLLEEQKKKNQTENSVPRNAPCPCGSGKRYKHCCGILI